MRISLHKQYWQALVLECSGMFWNLHLQEGPRKHLRQPSYQASRSQALWQPSGDGGKVRSGQCHVWSTPAAQLQGFFRTGYVRSMVCTSLPQSTKLKTAFTAWSTSFNYYNTCSHAPSTSLNQASFDCAFATSRGRFLKPKPLKVGFGSHPVSWTLEVPRNRQFPVTLFTCANIVHHVLTFNIF